MCMNVYMENRYRVMVDKAGHRCLVDRMHSISTPKGYVYRIVASFTHNISEHFVMQVLGEMERE